MIILSGVLIFCTVVSFAKADYCQEHPEPPLTENILLELAGILLTGTVGFNGCILTKPVVDQDVTFLRYDPTIHDWVVLDRTNPAVDPLKPFKIFVLGWAAGICSANASLLAEAYLQRYDCNVIGIDWSSRSIAEYSSAFCAVPGVADIIAKFLCVLSESFQVDLTQQLHTIGHSLGAQILGEVGRVLPQMCNTSINRISGLDPAGPLFAGKPTSQRLDQTDGLFVDVIHSNAGLAGYAGDCGHVDFYPNCGTVQNGCQQFSSIEEIIALPIATTTCSHIRSAYYWLESITGSKKFVSTSCKLCPGLTPVLPDTCPKDIFNPTYTIMGEDCPRNPPASKFYVKTNSVSPFAQG